ncbi:hypothetical protein [Deinococcus sp. 12RED42]|uniref:hypothetical protein n=1 Tax=Deinococcus sp. 12RED42 TaxID=2745872 RepID=UPI001E499A74|nr:hypothetical protein [Deinococcus sp. 12RED42]MCD0164725.1 hypothetical protein [Deinococcus sp. 12RED42]
MERLDLRQMLKEAGYVVSTSTLAKYLTIYGEETGRAEPWKLDDDVAATIIAACQYRLDNTQPARSMTFRTAVVAVLSRPNGTADKRQGPLQPQSEPEALWERKFDELLAQLIDFATAQATMQATLHAEQQRTSQQVVQLSEQLSALQAQVASQAIIPELLQTTCRTMTDLSAQLTTVPDPEIWREEVRDMLKQHAAWLEHCHKECIDHLNNRTVWLKEWRNESTNHLKDHGVWLRRNVEQLEAIEQRLPLTPLMDTAEIGELLQGARHTALLTYGFDLLEHPGGYVLVPRQDEYVPAPVPVVHVYEDEPEPEEPASFWSRIKGRLSLQ